MDENPADRAARVFSETESHIFYAMAKVSGAICHQQNDQWIKCRQEKEDNDPRRCLKEGEEASICALRVLEKVQTNCPSEFEQWSECLRKTHNQYPKCRPQQDQFYQNCVLKHFSEDDNLKKRFSTK
eukprot:CAMPEP_0201487428 /NCGR_PEP_ID=MMETSP0151_2-20130828/13080_1 /ASSEMBLY_ACC=CAM_ASM_000257 /TAXON_ID=200890 /ORGANISM="Paramoeba atlantica, Strain 621/1 / CCAP 1560/9" /LENGTH=126 /DNA_ID=CAMNT_0047872455 /DNA_START=61 /DNA_END=441 /DNA_ORIENTATION=+